MAVKRTVSIEYIETKRQRSRVRL